LNNENLLKNNSNFLDYKSKQFAKYGLNYYSLIISENDSMDRILSYQLRGEQDFIITNLNIIKTVKLSKNTIEEQDTLEKTIKSTEGISNAIDAGRIVTAADSLGASKAMLDKAVEYSKERKQFNRVIGSFQAVKHMCAEMASELEPCYSLVWHAAHSFDNNEKNRKLMACHAKSHVSDVSKMVSKKATEVHGGMGFTDLLGLHFWFKRIGVNRHILGSPEIVREEAAIAQNL